LDSNRSFHSTANAGNWRVIPHSYGDTLTCVAARSATASRLITVRFLRGNTGSGAADSELAPVAETEPEQDEVAHRARTGGQGRPPPTRREAEGRKRGPAPPPPRTQREAAARMRGTKEERRAEAAQRRERMLAGDERYLSSRDRGPVRAYVRDLVDSRW